MNFIFIRMYENKFKSYAKDCNPEGFKNMKRLCYTIALSQAIINTFITQDQNTFINQYIKYINRYINQYNILSSLYLNYFVKTKDRCFPSSKIALPIFDFTKTIRGVPEIEEFNPLDFSFNLDAFKAKPKIKIITHAIC